MMMDTRGRNFRFAAVLVAFAALICLALFVLDSDHGDTVIRIDELSADRGFKEAEKQKSGLFRKFLTNAQKTFKGKKTNALKVIDAGALRVIMPGKKRSTKRKSQDRTQGRKPVSKRVLEGLALSSLSAAALSEAEAKRKEAPLDSHRLGLLAKHYLKRELNKLHKQEKIHSDSKKKTSPMSHAKQQQIRWLRELNKLHKQEKIYSDSKKKARPKSHAKQQQIRWLRELNKLHKQEKIHSDSKKKARPKSHAKQQLQAKQSSKISEKTWKKQVRSKSIRAWERQEKGAFEAFQEKVKQTSKEKQAFVNPYKKPKKNERYFSKDAKYTKVLGRLHGVSNTKSSNGVLQRLSTAIDKLQSSVGAGTKLVEELHQQ